MTWRVARALDQLLWQWNVAHPNRSTASDGSIGNAAHQAQGNLSDHNPWVMDNGTGIVTARDFTHDPAHGADAGQLAEALKLHEDPRVKYVIWNRQIWSLARTSEGWRPYTGTNPHTHHVHVSVSPVKSLYDSMATWITTTTPTTTPPTGAADMTPEQAAQMLKLLATINSTLTGMNDRIGVLANNMAPNIDRMADKYVGPN